jgi:phage-related minor tail protein
MSTSTTCVGEGEREEAIEALVAACLRMGLSRAETEELTELFLRCARQFAERLQ